MYTSTTMPLIKMCIAPLILLVGLVILSLLGSQPTGDLELPRLVPTSVFGLRPEHHGELNLPNVPSSRLDVLREEYAGDSKAQQQIDVYDPTTEYHEKIAEYVQAIKEGNKERMAELDDWFGEYYPDI